ncbi:unnamed protein product, partial [Ectocarpus sp. 12 AP-2014]
PLFLTPISTRRTLSTAATFTLFSGRISCAIALLSFPLAGVAGLCNRCCCRPDSGAFFSRERTGSTSPSLVMFKSRDVLLLFLHLNGAILRVHVYPPFALSAHGRSGCNTFVRSPVLSSGSP